MNKTETKCQKAVKARIRFADGTEKNMEFTDWEAYSEYVEKHHDKITEASGVM